MGVVAVTVATVTMTVSVAMLMVTVMIVMVGAMATRRPVLVAAMIAVRAMAVRSFLHGRILLSPHDCPPTWQASPDRPYCIKKQPGEWPVFRIPFNELPFGTRSPL